MVDKESKVEYSFLIGLFKSVKNVAVTVGIPAVLVLLNSYAEWMPKSWYNVAVPMISVVSYLTKNYHQVKTKG